MFLKNMQQNNRFLRNVGPTKIRLLQCYVVTSKMDADVFFCLYLCQMVAKYIFVFGEAIDKGTYSNNYLKLEINQSELYNISEY